MRNNNIGRISKSVLVNFQLNVDCRSSWFIFQRQLKFKKNLNIHVDSLKIDFFV